MMYDDIRKSTYSHIDFKAIDAARNGVSEELARGVSAQITRVAEFAASLGGYGARITARCGRNRTERTGTLVPAATPDQWPHIRTDDGRHFRVCPDYIAELPARG